jgi:hypothetical protein
MAGYPCTYCKRRFPTVQECRDHDCDEFKQRLAELPWFIAAKVHRGGLKLEAAEKEAEEFRKENPPLRLD